MELLITIAYVFLIRLVFFDYKLLTFNLFWKFVAFGLYIAAALTEVIGLGQYTPYSKEAFVQSYVVPMAPQWGGLVKEVYAKPNIAVKKGDPLFEMDPAEWQYKLDAQQAALAAADTNVAELTQQLDEAKARVARTKADLALSRVKREQFSEAAASNAVSRLRLEEIDQQVAGYEAQLLVDQAAERAAQLELDSVVGGQHTQVAEVLAELETAKYNLEHTTIRAPADGYVTNLQLHPGGFVRLKTPVMTFVSSEEHWIFARFLQQGAQRIAPGDVGEVAFDMYPGKVFPVVVESVLWASGNAQGHPSGQLPTDQQFHPGHFFTARIRVTGNHPDHPLRFGASGIVAVYTKTAADALIVLRKLEIRSESYLNYLFNPF
jgi:multidrug resistance efflux pump